LWLESYLYHDNTRNSCCRCGVPRKRKKEKPNWHRTRGTRCTGGTWEKEDRARWRLDQSNAETVPMLLCILSRVPTDLESPGINLARESHGI